MDAWPLCLERLEAELPAEDVHTWLKPLQAEERGGDVVLYAPNAFIVDQVRERFLSRIRELLAYYAGSGTVELEIGSRPKPRDAHTAETAALPATAAGPLGCCVVHMPHGHGPPRHGGRARRAVSVQGPRWARGVARACGAGR